MLIRITKDIQYVLAMVSGDRGIFKIQSLARLVLSVSLLGLIDLPP